MQNLLNYCLFASIIIPLVLGAPANATIKLDKRDDHFVWASVGGTYTPSF